MQEAMSIVRASISEWMSRSDRSFYVLLYLMIVIKHLFTNDHGHISNIEYSGKWKNNGKFLQLGDFAFSSMTLSQISFCSLSAMLAVIGDRIPHFIAMLQLCALQLCGFISTILFMNPGQDSAGAIREALECTGLIYVTMSILPPQVKAGLSCWRYVFLSLNLFISLTWIFSMMRKKFNEIYLADIFPLVGLCATSVIILALKAIGAQTILIPMYDILINISTLFWIFLGIVILYSQPSMEKPAFSDEYRPGYWFAYTDIRIGCYLTFFTFNPRMAWVYSTLLCVMTMFTFNLMSAWRGEFEFEFSEKFFGKYPDMNFYGFVNWKYLIEEPNSTYHLYLVTLIILIIYFCAQLYGYLSVKKPCYPGSNIAEIEADETFPGDTEDGGVGDHEVKENRAKNDDIGDNGIEDHYIKDNETNDNKADNDKSSVFTVEPDPRDVYYFKLARCKENICVMFIYSDWFLLYVSSAFFSLEYLFPAYLVAGLLLVLQIFGYIATISLKSVFFFSDMSRYVLTHVAIHTTFLTVLPVDDKYILSQHRNILLILSVISAKILFILKMIRKDSSFKSIAINILLWAPMMAEGLAANALFHSLNNVDGIEKLLVGKISTRLYEYNFVWFFVSVLFEIGYIILSELNFRNYFDIEVFELFLDFYRIVIGSIMFHVGPILIYSLLSRWCYQHTGNIGIHR